jgi:tryptophan synthase alpha chain
MNRIDQRFAQLRASGRKGLIGYLTAGDPDLEVTGALVLEMARCGVDMVELGVPFSDPVADGPVIQAASARALKKGVTLEDVLALAGTLRARTGIPLLMMTYYNPIFAYGIPKFVKTALKSGIDGVVVPDLPLEESEELCQAMETAGIHFIYFLSPTSSAERIVETVKRARGFIYCVSVTGVTGAREAISELGRKLLNRVGGFTQLPLALGFGISSPEQLIALGDDGDAVIIGSAIVKLVEAGGTTEEIINRVGKFLNDFKFIESFRS